MTYELSAMMKSCAIILIVWCSISLSNVAGDVSEINGIKTFASTTTSTSSDDSDSFSILTKEFLNRPDEFGKRNSVKATTRQDSDSETNKLSENEDSDEHQGYFYDRPKIPFEFESTNIHTNTVPPAPAPAPKAEESDEFDGYHYDKPAIPFDLPTTTDNPDSEKLPAGRLLRGR